jgi:PAS domain S-box-containing protein
MFYLIYLALLLLPIICGPNFAVYAWRNRRVTGAHFFTYSSLNSTFWAIFVVLSMLSQTAEGAYFWIMYARLSMVAFISVLALGFTLEYAGQRNWLQWRRFGWLFILPIGGIVTVIFRPELYIADYTIVERAGFLFFKDLSYGVLFYGMLVYNYLTTFFALLILLNYAFRTRHIYRVQTLVLIASLFFPFLANLPTVARGQIDIFIDLTPVGFMFTYIVWGWAIFRVQFLNLIPIAHHAILEGMQDSVLVFDVADRVVELNPAAAQITEFERDKIIGKSIHEVLDPIIVQRHTNMDHSLSEIKLHKQNQTIYYELYTSTLYRQNNHVAGRAIVLRDITERKQAEERKLKLQLEQERRRLLENFVQNAAHEFRTPLAIIETSSYLMSRSDNPEYRTKNAGKVNMQIKRITRLVDSLLIITKLENNETLASDLLDIGALVSPLCDKEAQNCPKNHHIEYDIQPDLPLVPGDADYLNDALRQVMDNACRFTPNEGQIDVKVRYTNGRINIDIRDSGPGIPQDELPHIFETFWRQDTAHSTPGFGLGLPIAQKIIARHGGEVTVESEVEQGTAVRISLPATPTD